MSDVAAPTTTAPPIPAVSSGDTSAPAPPPAATPASPPAEKATALPENFDRQSTADKMRDLRERSIKTPEQFEKAKPQKPKDEEPEREAAPAPTPEPKVETPAETPAPEEAPGRADVPADEDEAPVAPRTASLMKAIDTIPDSKVRYELRNELRLAHDYRKLMPISEVKERLALAPSINAARENAGLLGEFGQIRDALVSGTPEGHTHFLAQLHEAAPDAAQAFVKFIGQNLHAMDREAFVAATWRGFQNVLGVAQRIEQTSGKDSWTLAELADLARPRSQGQGAIPPTHPVVQQNQQLQAQLRERDAERFNQFTASTYDAYGQTLVKRADTLLSQLDPDKLLPEEGRRRLISEVLDSVSGQVRANPVVGERTNALLYHGSLDQAHQREVVDHLMSNTEPLLAQAMADGYTAYRKELRSFLQRAPKPSSVASPELPAAAPAAAMPSRKMPNLEGMNTVNRIEALRKAGVGGRR